LVRRCAPRNDLKPSGPDSYRDLRRGAPPPLGTGGA
jgi:hypothetical protein